MMKMINYGVLETPATIAGKSEFIEDTGLGGMMFWALSSDAQGENSLIKAANDVLNNGDSPLDVANRGPQFDDIIKGDGRFTMSDFTGYLTHASVSASKVANIFGFDDTFRTKIQGKSRHHNLHGSDRDEHIISHYKKKGHDILSGRGGDDILESGPGRDVMHGGSGDDHFHIHTKGRAANYNFDTILDFSSRDDKLLLTDVNDVRFGVDSEATKEVSKSDENLIYDEQSGYLYFDFIGLAPGNGKNKAVIPTVLLNGSQILRKIISSQLKRLDFSSCIKIRILCRFYSLGPLQWVPLFCCFDYKCLRRMFLF